MVELNDVSVSYGNGTESLSHLTLKVPDGEFCFITGKSGSGKSTLSKLLTGEIQADDGVVRVNNFDMSKMSKRSMAEARRTTGMVFQDFRLITSMTAEQNLEFAMRCVNASETAMDRRIPEVLNLVSLEGKEDRLPSELSGGEQQRVAIARAIINRPSLIIADEPTGNLDPDLAVDIMKLFVRINEMGTTTMVITHALELVERFQKRVITLSGGKLIRDANALHGGVES